MKTYGRKSDAGLNALQRNRLAIAHALTTTAEKKIKALEREIAKLKKLISFLEAYNQSKNNPADVRDNQSQTSRGAT